MQLHRPTRLAIARRGKPWQAPTSRSACRSAHHKTAQAPLGISYGTTLKPRATGSLATLEEVDFVAQARTPLASEKANLTVEPRKCL